MGTSVRMTVDDLLRMPDDGFMYELVHGELKQMPAPGVQHATIAGRLFLRLATFVEARKLGLVWGDGLGYKLAEDTMLAPDGSFVRRERIPSGGLPVGFWEGVPDLAVEIISPNDTLKEVAEKAVEFIGYGTRMVWVINPRNRTATIYRPGQEPRAIAADGSLDGEDVVPDFTVALVDLFA